MRGADALIHVAGRYRDRDPGARSGRRCGTRTSARPSGCSTPRSRSTSAGSCTCRPSTCSATPTATSSTRRTAATSPRASCPIYDETKYRAHQAAEDADRGRRPDRHRHAEPGLRPARPQPRVGAGPPRVRGHAAVPGARQRRHRAGSHVDDLADGILAALDRGQAGESYVLSGPHHRSGEAQALAARLGGKRMPRLAVPASAHPVDRAAQRRPGRPAGHAAEHARDGQRPATASATSRRARRRSASSGFAPRSLEQGIVDTWGRR